LQNRSRNQAQSTLQSWAASLDPEPDRSARVSQGNHECLGRRVQIRQGVRDCSLIWLLHTLIWQVIRPTALRLKYHHLPFSLQATLLSSIQSSISSQRPNIIISITSSRQHHLFPSTLHQQLYQHDWTRKGRQGSRKGWCQASSQDSTRQHPGNHKACYPSSRSSWWCQAYLSQYVFAASVSLSGII